MRLLLTVALFLMLPAGWQLAAAADTWNWDEPWEPDDHVLEADFADVLPASTVVVFELPQALLSYETHGAYFGSGDEYLLGGGQVYGIGGSRHTDDRSLNNPASAQYPGLQHLFDTENGFLGPLWGAPEENEDTSASVRQQDPRRNSGGGGAGSKSKIGWLRDEN